jgi:RNA polymerase sigma-70 factor (ECF subfamily)
METLARERGPALVGYAYLLTGEIHAAQDLVQEALIRTFSRRRGGAEIASLEAYARRAVLNVYLDGYRRRRTWSGIQHLAVGSRAALPPDDAVADRADVRAALSRLSPRERSCVVLRHYEDLTVPEIAQTLGLSQGSVKRYLSDARSRLGVMLDDGERTYVDVTRTGGTAR